MVTGCTEPSHNAFLQVCRWRLYGTGTASTQIFSFLCFICFNNRVTISKLEECSHKQLSSVPVGIIEYN